MSQWDSNNPAINNKNNKNNNNKNNNNNNQLPKLKMELKIWNKTILELKEIKSHIS